VKLHEILDNAYKFEVEDDGDKLVGHFKDDSGELVIVNAEYWGGPELYIIDFKRKGEFEMTNDSPKDKNQAVRILTTVIDIVKKMLKMSAADQPAKFIAFSSSKSEASRSSLYNRLVDRVAPAIGYRKVTDASTIDHPVLPGWWKNKIKMSGRDHDFTLLARKDV
jgi:hypothetical protein